MVNEKSNNYPSVSGTEDSPFKKYLSKTSITINDTVAQDEFLCIDEPGQSPKQSDSNSHISRFRVLLNNKMKFKKGSTSNDTKRRVDEIERGNDYFIWIRKRKSLESIMQSINVIVGFIYKVLEQFIIFKGRE